MTLIDIFGRAISEGYKLSFAEVNALAVRCGYLIHPDCCTKEVYDWLKTKEMNPNSTFYKTWDKIVSTSRMELAFDQILHYMSTYGTNFEGKAWIPNDEPEIIPYNTYKEILPISVEDLHTKCVTMIYSGIALSKETLLCVCDFIIEHKELSFDIDAVKNREAMIYLCEKLNISPKDKFNLLRYMVYKTTGETLLIQNKALITKIKYARQHFDFTTLSEEQLISLSSIFLRFKNIFLAFKGEKNSYVINKLRRLAVKYHKPIPEDFWGTLCFRKPSIEEIEKRLPELNTFRKVSLYQAVMTRLSNPENRVFIIRNQKVFVTENLLDESKSYFSKVSYLIRKSIINDLKSKVCAFSMPKNLNIACPTSEKNFIGDLPIGSSFNIEKDAILGIYWRNEWGTRDFDLSLVNSAGHKIGWDAEYTSHEGKVLYSGDMTNADPEATELLLFRDPDVEGIIQVNRYRGEEGSKFRFFYSDEEVKDLKRNYMVTPDSIKVNVDCISDITQQSLAIISNRRVTFMRLGTGSSIVSRSEYSQKMFNTFKEKIFLDLKLVLLEAGFHEATLEDKDPMVFNKETIINLFTKE